ncbi:MAG: hypothetical protein GY866_08070 [Proteobacteria bacterium]|nr:hypothetical protein [Pseudomonadota bacterium]
MKKQSQVSRIFGCRVLDASLESSVRNDKYDWYIDPGTIVVKCHSERSEDAQDSGAKRVFAPGFFVAWFLGMTSIVVEFKV